MNPSFSASLQQYYSSRTARAIISTIYILNQLALTLYLLFIPIQIAYFWLLVKINNGDFQSIIDFCVLGFFILHVLLYLDEKFQEWMKSPYLKWYKKLVSFQVVYDLLCVVLSIYAIVMFDRQNRQRIYEIFYVGKVYKLIKFDVKCMYIVVGTMMYPFYKIVRTLLILAMVISYVGSLFYGVAYYLYTLKIQYMDLLWIVQTGAFMDLVDQPMIIQLLYSLYWALGTASTAAYGDISASQPTLILINILALAFEGFLFGFYLNSMHSIPNQKKQQQSNMLEQFDSFQHHASNRKIEKKLYLQILCSLQYSSSQKRNLNEIQKFLPKKYLQQIKYSVYGKVLDHPIFFSDFQFQMKLAQSVQETVSQIGEDVYDYRDVRLDDLIFVQDGQVDMYISGELKEVSRDAKLQGEFFGILGFISGLYFPQKALSINYCFFYRIRRQDYKSMLPIHLKPLFNQLQIRSFSLQGSHLQREAVVRLVSNLNQSDSKLRMLFNQQEKQKNVLGKHLKMCQHRAHCQRDYHRKDGHAKKIYVRPETIRVKSVDTQTDPEQFGNFQIVEQWGQTSNDLMARF